MYFNGLNKKILLFQASMNNLMGETYNWFILTKVRTRKQITNDVLRPFFFFLLLFLLQYSARTMKHAPLNQGNDEFSGNLLLQMKKKDRCKPLPK
jgi:hypothetical protein